VVGRKGEFGSRTESDNRARMKRQRHKNGKKDGMTKTREEMRKKKMGMESGRKSTIET
jgi:hypothetical protein